MVSARSCLGQAVIAQAPWLQWCFLLLALGPTPDKHRPGSWDTVQEAAAPAPQLLGDLSRSSSWGGSPSLYLGTFHPGPGAQEGSVVLICWHPGTFMRM